MGTRSTVKFYDGGYVSEEEKGTCLCAVYQQYDGYPEGVGYELASMLKDIEIVNGFSTGMKAGTHANGVGCLAAQFVKTYKQGLGGMYMTTENDTQEYDYEVYIEHGEEPRIRVKNWGDLIFDGNVDELYEEVSKYV